jgi:glycosyltransferase involved in cell wall biosynthesis
MSISLSVVVINYNYGKFIEQCVRSILDQDLCDIELIVVDDGSTDNSLEIINSIVDMRLRWVSQTNGGMISAMNRGFAETRGPFVAFVDADDYLLPGALRLHFENLAQPDVVRSQGYLEVLQDERSTDMRLPGRVAPEGDLRRIALHQGPGAVVSAPNSGNAWSKRFLRHVFPLPLGPRRLGAETFLMDAAPLFGLVKTMDQPVGVYRLHSTSMSHAKRNINAQILSDVVDGYAMRFVHLAKIARLQGYGINESDWLSRNWRLLTVRNLLSRHSGRRDLSPNLGRHLRSALDVSGGWHKKLAVAMFMIGLKSIPVRPAMRVAGIFIHPHYM